MKIKFFFTQTEYYEHSFWGLYEDVQNPETLSALIKQSDVTILDYYMDPNEEGGMESMILTMELGKIDVDIVKEMVVEIIKKYPVNVDCFWDKFYLSLYLYIDPSESSANYLLKEGTSDFFEKVEKVDVFKRWDLSKIGIEGTEVETKEWVLPIRYVGDSTINLHYELIDEYKYETKVKKPKEIPGVTYIKMLVTPVKGKEDDFESMFSDIQDFSGNEFPEEDDEPDVLSSALSVLDNGGFDYEAFFDRYGYDENESGMMLLSFFENYIEFTQRKAGELGEYIRDNYSVNINLVFSEEDKETCGVYRSLSKMSEDTNDDEEDYELKEVYYTPKDENQRDKMSQMALNDVELAELNEWFNTFEVDVDPQTEAKMWESME